jgi:lysyl-tRNA synthetase class 2
MKRFRAAAPAIIGRLAYLIGLIDIFENVIRPVKKTASKINNLLPVAVNSTAFATALFTGILIIIIARGLIRRKRRAWLFAVIVVALNIGSDLFRNHYHPRQLTVMAILFIALIAFRAEFYAVSDPATKRQPLYAFLRILGLVVISGLLLVEFRNSDQLLGNPSFGKVFLYVIEGLVGISGSLKFANDHTGDAIDNSLLALGIFTIVIPLALYFRRVSPQKKMSDEDFDLVKKLINHDRDQDSLGYFATRRDKNVIYSNNKKAGIAYRVQGGVMLASGDPFGEYSLWGEAIENFLEEARRHAWTPAVMGASDHGGEVWVEKAGMLAIDIGDEAVIKVSDFTLEGRPMANVRQMVNRVIKKGFTTETAKFVELPAETQKELRSLAKHWRYGVPERGFSMSLDRFGEACDENTYITIARQDGAIKGLLYFVPWCDDRLSLDRMQRERGSETGINEYLIASTVEFAKTHGITHISLNFAAFRSLFERADKISAGPITRGTRNIIRFFNNWFQVESLLRFNAKFQPEWQTRYVLYPRTADLAKVAWAALRAEKFITAYRSKAVK